MSSKLRVKELNFYVNEQYFSEEMQAWMLVVAFLILGGSRSFEQTLLLWITRKTEEKHLVEEIRDQTSNNAASIWEEEVRDESCIWVSISLGSSSYLEEDMERKEANCPFNTLVDPRGEKMESKPTEGRVQVGTQGEQRLQWWGSLVPNTVLLNHTWLSSTWNVPVGEWKIEFFKLSFILINLNLSSYMWQNSLCTKQCYLYEEMHEYVHCSAKYYAWTSRWTKDPI